MPKIGQVPREVNEHFLSLLFDLTNDCSEPEEINWASYRSIEIREGKLKFRTSVSRKSTVKPTSRSTPLATRNKYLLLSVFWLRWLFFILRKF